MAIIILILLTVDKLFWIVDGKELVGSILCLFLSSLLPLPLIMLFCGCIFCIPYLTCYYDKSKWIISIDTKLIIDDIRNIVDEN